jgi:hypothetical protein
VGVSITGASSKVAPRPELATLLGLPLPPSEAGARGREGAGGGGCAGRTIAGGGGGMGRHRTGAFRCQEEAGRPLPPNAAAGTGNPVPTLYQPCTHAQASIPPLPVLPGGLGLRTACASSPPSSSSPMGFARPKLAREVTIRNTLVWQGEAGGRRASSARDGEHSGGVCGVRGRTNQRASTACHRVHAPDSC